MRKKKVVFTVFNDLPYDQRMQKICSSMHSWGYDVTLVGRRQKGMKKTEQPYRQIRLWCPFYSGFLMYASYNTQLFFRLLFLRFDAVCAIDLDTILPCYFNSVLRKKKRVYDAHEYFSELKEIVERPAIYRIWKKIESFAIPRFKNGYTVNDFIAAAFQKRYGVSYRVVRNLPKLQPLPATTNTEKIIIYQGAVNEGRSFETLIPAMLEVDATLIICGKGNFFLQTKELIATYNLEDKIILKGYVLPSELKTLTPTAHVAVMLFEETGLNQYYSLSNRFFDYIMACVPQLCVNYPEYEKINRQYDVCLMIDDTNVQTIAAGLNRLLSDSALHARLKRNCIKAREELCWDNEEATLEDFWEQIFTAT